MRYQDDFTSLFSSLTLRLQIAFDGVAIFSVDREKIRFFCFTIALRLAMGRKLEE